MDKIDGCIWSKKEFVYLYYSEYWNRALFLCFNKNNVSNRSFYKL